MFVNQFSLVSVLAGLCLASAFHGRQNANHAAGHQENGQVSPHFRLAQRQQFKVPAATFEEDKRMLEQQGEYEQNEVGRSNQDRNPVCPGQFYACVLGPSDNFTTVGEICIQYTWSAHKERCIFPARPQDYTFQCRETLNPKAWGLIWLDRDC